MMRADNQRGFTLLELIVVVAIIGIIAAIALPQYHSYKNRAETASVLSNCRSLYRAFTVFYLEAGEYTYPSKPGDGEWDEFDTDLFFPLNDPANLGGINFDIDINQLRATIGGVVADRLYVSQNAYQEYYLVMPWGKDPNVLFIVASASNVKDKNGNLIDNGNWLDGVYVWRDGKLSYQ